MKIVKIKGGIGNQLFQYAFAKHLEKCGYETTLDLSQYNFRVNSINNFKLDKFFTKYKEANSNDLGLYVLKNKYSPSTKIYKIYVILEFILNRKFYFEKSRRYRIINYKKYDIYDGYWQSENYFQSFSEELKKEITPKVITKETSKFLSDIAMETKVFIGIRRPYSFERKNMKKNLDIVSNNLNYYNNAIKYISKNVKRPLFIVFSNDIEWVKENIVMPESTIYRSKEIQSTDEEELYIMSNCDHAIISNSTFHWWGAWLIDNQNKIVVAPKRWQQNYESNIIPETWVRF